MALQLVHLSISHSESCGSPTNSARSADTPLGDGGGHLDHARHHRAGRLGHGRGVDGHLAPAQPHVEGLVRLQVFVRHRADGHQPELLGQHHVGRALEELGHLVLQRAHHLLVPRAREAAAHAEVEELERMRTASISEHAQIIEFKKRGIGEKGTWRLQPDGDLLLICQFADKTFGFGGRPQQAVYILRRDVQIHHEGDRWLGKNINATLSVGGAENKVQLKPEMLARLESLLTGTSSAPTDANWVNATPAK